MIVIVQKYCADPKVQYEKRPRGVQGETVKSNLSSDRFSTKIIAFHLNKIPKVFHSQTIQKFNIKYKILLHNGGAQVLIRLFMNVVILPIKCIYGANKHNIVIGSWQKWKWQ